MAPAPSTGDQASSRTGAAPAAKRRKSAAKARRAPPDQAAAPHVEQEGVSHRGAVRLEMRLEVGGNVSLHLREPAVYPAPAQLAERALLDDPADLEPPVVGRKGESGVAAAEVGPRRSLAGEGRQRHLAPDDVEVLRRAFLVQAGADPEDRRAPVGPDHEIAADLVRARARLGTDADDALALAHEVPHGRATLQLERREAARLGDEHLEHGRLRDDARAFDAEVADRDTQETAGAAVDLEPADLRLREAVELGA